MLLWTSKTALPTDIQGVQVTDRRPSDRWTSKTAIASTTIIRALWYHDPCIVRKYGYAIVNRKISRTHRCYAPLQRT